MQVRTQPVAAVVTLAAMVATPLNRRGGRIRRALSTIVVSGLHATTLAGTARRWGGVRAVAAAGTTTVGTGLVEHVGQRTGRPFGRYRYTSALQPQLGGVPVVVPLAWFAMAVPARETAHAALGARSSPGTRVVAGAAALAAWDLFLDPQMVGEGYWRWFRPGRYRGVPFENFVGWFATGLGVMALLELVLPPDLPAADLIAEYGVMGVMETAGFAAFFEDRLVAVVGGLGMLPLAALALMRVSPAG
jgi:putative membrane protein